MRYQRPAWLEINLSAVKENIKFLKGKISINTEIMAVVKAEAYGHGSVQVSRAALEGGASRLGVALIEEGIKLIKNGIEAEIQILNEPPVDGIPEILEYGLIPTVCTRQFIDELASQSEKAGKQVKFHLKVDTGMNRIGILPEQAVPFLERALSYKNLTLEGVFTHLAAADQPEAELTQIQLEKFSKVVESFNVKGINVAYYHTANSAGIIYHSNSHYDLVRPGISIYGLAPNAELGLPEGLKPVLAWKSRISFIKEIPAGEGVSYGHTFIAPKPTKVATIPLGYADGYFRLLSNKAEVLIKGQRKKVIGNICMDQFMVDLGKVDVTIGEEAVLIGGQGSERITAEEIASHIGTINYEVTSRISERVPRFYKE